LCISKFIWNLLIIKSSKSYQSCRIENFYRGDADDAKLSPAMLFKNADSASLRPKLYTAISICNPRLLEKFGLRVQFSFKITKLIKKNHASNATNATNSTNPTHPINPINPTNPTNPISSMNPIDPKYFLITIDVEDWFQVENFKPWIPFETWDQRELRVEKNVHRLLDLFDSIETPARPADATNPTDPKNPINPTGAITPKATFFVLGWIAERLPHLVREIQSRGHEVASHGMYHELCNKIPKNELINALSSSKKLLEDTLGSEIFGFRAPSFAIDDNILKGIEESGYLYDSSFNSFNLHNRYGKINLTCNRDCGSFVKINEKFYELPISNLRILNQVIPLGGGGYFRLIPFLMFKIGIKAVLRKNNDFMFYLHPWEIDPDQPIVHIASKKYKFRHYANLEKSYGKLMKLINYFQNCKFLTCAQYIAEIQKN